MYNCAYTGVCTDISMCKLCFLNANNYLIIKYLSLNHIKNQHYENKKTLYQKV